MMKNNPVIFCVLLLVSQSCAAEVIENYLGMRFVKIPAGEFVMGNIDLEAALMEVPEAESGDLREETPAHSVTISKEFYMGVTEVTQAQWLRVMENRPGPEAVWQREDWRVLPVAAVNWFMAQRFIEEMNALDSDYHYRLPTEAEWEYVARAGVNRLRPVPVEQLEDYAWFINNSGDIPQAVATRKANAFGVYDMLGNVWEWVSDWYAPDTYTAGPRVDPAGPRAGTSKVRRGGSFHCPLHQTRPGYRSANAPDTRYEVIGFRMIAAPRSGKAPGI